MTILEMKMGRSIDNFAMFMNTLFHWYVNRQIEKILIQTKGWRILCISFEIGVSSIGLSINQQCYQHWSLVLYQRYSKRQKEYV